MGDHDFGAGLAPDAVQFGVHLFADEVVEGAVRFDHEQHFGFVQQRAARRGALLRAADELVGKGVRVRSVGADLLRRNPIRLLVAVPALLQRGRTESLCRFPR